MSDIGLTHIALPVRSLAASVAFYSKYANMQAVHRRPGVAWISDRTRPFAVVLIETSNEIKPLLPHLLVTRYERNPFRVRFVLVGTWLAQYAGADFTGRYLDELDFSSELDTDWSAHHVQFVKNAQPRQSSMFVRSPDALCRSSRSSPIVPPSRQAVSSLVIVPAESICCSS